MAGTTSREGVARAERRIAWLTLALGIAAAAAVAVRGPWPAAVGVAAGTGLAWLNFRWLEAGVTALTRAAVTQSAGPETPRPRIPLGVQITFFGRYALLAAMAYGIVAFFRVPIWSIFAGLFALGAAAMVEGIYEVIARPR